MLTRLTRITRIKAARMLVALYAFCVVFPAAGLAFSSDNAPNCLTPVVQAMHAEHRHASAHEDQGQGGHHHHTVVDEEAGVSADHAGHRHGKDAPRDMPMASGCCGVMCMNALPASLFELAPRTVAHLAASPVSDAGIAGEAPALLYRPPIALMSL